MKYVLAVISMLLLLLVIGGAAFYFGQKSILNSALVPTPTLSQINNINPTGNPTQGVQTNPNPDTNIEAGGALSFPKYSLTTPSDWVSSREQGENNDKLTLTKNGYEIAIYEAAFGGGGCLYPGDAPSQFAQTFSSFVEIQNANGFVFRRSPVSATGKSAWTVCQKNTSDGSFGSPTQFGAISITGPLTPNDSAITEVDKILASINKK